MVGLRITNSNQKGKKALSFHTKCYFDFNISFASRDGQVKAQSQVVTESRVVDF